MKTKRAFEFPRTPEELAKQIRNRQLATAPLPTTRRILGKSWAGALISNLDDAFGVGRLGRSHITGYTGADYDANHPARAWEEELTEALV